MKGNRLGKSVCLQDHVVLCTLYLPRCVLHTTLGWDLVWKWEWWCREYSVPWVFPQALLVGLLSWWGPGAGSPGGSRAPYHTSPSEAQALDHGPRQQQHVLGSRTQVHLRVEGAWSSSSHGQCPPSVLNCLLPVVQGPVWVWVLFRVWLGLWGWTPVPGCWMAQ